MKKLAIVFAVGAAALLGGSAANAADNPVKAKTATGVTQQSTDFSSRGRHYRHYGYRHYGHRHYGIQLERIHRSFNDAVLVVDDGERSNSIVFACRGPGLRLPVPVTPPTTVAGSPRPRPAPPRRWRRC